MSADAATPLPNEWKPRANPWLIAVTVTLATFMEVLDTSIANVALPHIAGSLAASQSESTWVLTSYLVSNAIVLPVSAWMSSVMGRKRFYMSCVALFTLSSALCGLAPSLGALVFFRVLQGAGGGGLQPSEQAILADTFPPARRGMAFAIYGVAVVCAPVLGPTLGGWITDNYSWRWIFYINLPVGIVSLVLTPLIVEDPPRARTRGMRASGGLDTIGLGLITLGLGALQVMLDKGQEDDWFSSLLIRTCAVLSAVGLIGTIIWELRHPHPIVNLRLFAERNFATAFVLLFLMGLLLLGSTTLLPLSSLINLARNIGQSVGASVVSTFLDRWSQVHQGFLVGHMTPFAAPYRWDLHRLILALAAHGASIGAAQHRAAQVLYDTLQRQSTMLAVTDIFRLMAFLCFAGLPLLVLFKRYDPRHVRAAVH
jgi:MFS transporter, DHA2 family, multidrug resistance protein